MKKLFNTLLVCMAMIWPFCTNAQLSHLDSLRLIGQNLYSTLPPNSIIDGMLPENHQLQTFLDGNREQFMNHYLFQDAVYYFNEQRQQPLPIPDFESFQNIAANYHNQHLIPLGLIDYNYYAVKSEVVEQNLIYPNVPEFALKIVPGNEASWYQQKSFTYLSSFYPITEENTCNFIIPTNLVFSNRPELNSIWVNVGDNRGWFLVNFDVPFSVTNAILGRELSMKFSVTGPQNGLEPEIQIPVENERSIILNKKAFADEEMLVSELNMSGIDPCFDNYRNPQKPNDIRIGEARISILYNNRNEGLKKPIIFIEGFDVDNNPLDDRFGDVNFNTLITGLSFNSEGKSVKENLKDLPILINKFRSRGFDIVFIDFKNGGGDMIANGNAVIKIIQFLNAHKNGTEENVVMGASMGGLLARYALSKMEKNGCNHCTKLYVTFDSPHQGAHVPIGLQYMMEFSAKYADSEEAKAIYKIALGSMGAQQMLQKNIFPGADEIRNQWKSLLSELGHPQKCRKVAVANGNPEGVKFNFESGAVLFDWKLVKGDADLSIFNIKSGPNCPSSQCNDLVFAGKMPKGASKIGMWSNSFFSLDYIYEEYRVGIAEHRNWDNAPGGSAKYLSDAANLPVWKAKGGPEPTLPSGSETCFVPIISALDASFSDLYEDFKQHFNVIKDQKKRQSFHPFDAIHFNVFNQNQAHVFIDNQLVASPQNGEQNNIDFILEQLDLVESKLESSLPNTKGNTFNLANSPNELFIQRLPGLTINNGGILHFNGNIRTNYGTSNELINEEGSLMQYRTANCYSNIQINNQGTMILGDNNMNANGNNKALVSIDKGSELLINSGGILHIHTGSKLVIEEGATLVYKQGARIILDGSLSDLEIKGKLIIENGAELKFESGTSNLNGRLVLVKTSENAGKPIRNSSSNTKVTLTGQNVNDEILVVKGGTIDLGFLGELNLSNGMVMVDDNSRIYLANNELDIHHVVFKSLQSNPINTVGIELKNEKSIPILLANNSFKNLKVGIVIQTDNYTPSIKVNYSTFYNCETGIYSNYQNIDIEHCGFFNCKKGLSANNLYNYGFGKIRNCQFDKNETGAELNALADFDVFLESNTFTGNSVGLSSNSYTRLTLQCNTFISNHTGIMSNGTVNMSANRYFSGNVGKNNSFYNNEFGLFLDQAELYLENGENNFYSTKLGLPPIYPNYGFINGSIRQPSACLDINNRINAAQNYWYPVPSSGHISTAGSQYYNIAPIYLTGNMRTHLNNLCFNLSEAQQYQGNGGNGKQEGHLQLKSSLQINPNPAKHELTILFNSSEDVPAQIILSDLTGKHVLVLENQQFVKGNNVRYLDISELTKGMYIVSIDQNGKVLNQKWIKE